MSRDKLYVTSQVMLLVLKVKKKRRKGKFVPLYTIKTYW